MDTAKQQLENENTRYKNTCGISECNKVFGCKPAFKNIATGEVQLSTLNNGTPAPIHLTEGLPASWFDDEVTLNKDIVSGFLLENQFLTREQAAATLNQ